MTVANWVRWHRTALDLHERKKVLDALTPEQKHGLVRAAYVWVERVGVIWRPQGGGLRLARFTHGFAFETRHGSFHIDAEGTVREVRAPAKHAPSPRSAALIPAFAGAAPRPLRAEGERSIY